MERPSHIIFNQQQSWFRRTTVIAVAAGLQLAGFWLFTHGLATRLPPIFQPFHYVPVEEKNVPPPKPPEPEIQKKIEVIVVPPPVFGTELPPKPGGLTTSLPPGNEDGTVMPPEHIVHAAVGILSTHTVPPYPPIARRLGEEGKVTLRLAVSAEGRVTEAEIVRSSGREDLDQAAQSWIVAHWTYKPAQDNGVAVTSQVLATVAYSLSELR